MMADSDEEIFEGVIYILVNQSFPKYVKIGYTNDINRTLNQLNNSDCLPYPYQLYAYYGSKTPLSDDAVDKMIDSVNPYLRTINAFDSPRGKREFYEVAPSDAYHMLQYIATTTYTIQYLHLIHKGEKLNIKTKSMSSAIKVKAEVTKQERVRTKKVQAERFSFTKCGIEPGSVITYIDDPSITAIVIDEYNVEYEGEVYSTSKLAQKISGFNYALRGTIFWKYNGELLADRRTRLEKLGLYK